MDDLFLSEYGALHDGAAVQLRADAGVLAVTDADRVDFLQRMTTNHVLALRAGQSCVTVLTSPVAKIVQVFTVVARDADLLLLPARGGAHALARHLHGQIFFMDKVKVTDVSAQFVRLRIMGKQAQAVLAAAGCDLGTPAEGDWREQKGVLAVAQGAFDVPGCEVIVPVDQQAAFLRDLLAAGAVELTGDAAYTARRVELARPAPDAELVGEYSPLEAGLAWACAANKGCYTGQEIIARQVTYDKVTRTLVSLHSESLLPAGAVLTVDGREVGVVTSAAFSPAQARPLALAVVKRPHNEPGTVLAAGGQRVQVF